MGFALWALLPFRLSQASVPGSIATGHVLRVSVLMANGLHGVVATWRRATWHHVYSYPVPCLMAGSAAQGTAVVCSTLYHETGFARFPRALHGVYSSGGRDPLLHSAKPSCIRNMQ